jgi:hypothetical protein
LLAQVHRVRRVGDDLVDSERADQAEHPRNSGQLGSFAA